MKKIYETPAVEIAVLEAKEDILAGSNDVIVDVGDLFIVDVKDELSIN